MAIFKKLLIGGKALVNMGSSRSTNDTDFLVCDTATKAAFIKDHENNIDYCNANGNEFFAAIWKMELRNSGEMASPQAILELKAYALVQHCQNGNWQKADDCEYDMKFIVRKFGLKTLKIANKFMSKGELAECMKILNSVK